MRVALFASCLVDALKPDIGFASLRLLEAAGCEVSVPEQTCCGQVNFNSGDVKGARAFARQWLTSFEHYDYVVFPSGSCAAMLKGYAATLFDDQTDTQRRLQALAEKVYELSQFLQDIASPQFDHCRDRPTTQYCYHDSCSGLRTLGIKTQPRDLLANLAALELKELPNAEACCGFGGTFCIKHPEISCQLADDKIAAIDACGAQLLVGGDWGCLMHLQARLAAQDKPVEVKHFSEVLADFLVSDKT